MTTPDLPSIQSQHQYLPKQNYIPNQPRPKLHLHSRPSRLLKPPLLALQIVHRPFLPLNILNQPSHDLLTVLDRGLIKRPARHSSLQRI